MIYSFFNLQPYHPSVTGMDILGDLFNSGVPSIMLLKLGIAIILFAILLKGTEKLFPENHGTSVIISLLLSILGIVFIPDAYIIAISTSFGALSIVVLIGVVVVIPWLLVDALLPNLRSSRWKWLFYAVMYGGLAYAFTKLSGIDALRNISPGASGILDFISTKGAVILVIIAVICLLIGFFGWLFRRREGGDGGGADRGDGHQPRHQRPQREPREPGEPRERFWRRWRDNWRGIRYREREAARRQAVERNRYQVYRRYDILIRRALRHGRHDLATRLQQRRDSELNRIRGLG